MTCEEMTMDDLKQSVSTYYGQTIQQTQDLVYDACCTTDYDPTLTTLADVTGAKSMQGI